VAAELGLAGLLAFALMLAGALVAGRRALRRAPGAAAGLVAGALVWFLHASIDWDWQLPAVTLPAIVLAGAFVALSEDSADDQAAGAAQAADSPPLALSGAGR
jgi:hypothetical protein